MAGNQLRGGDIMGVSDFEDNDYVYHNDDDVIKSPTAPVQPFIDYRQRSNGGRLGSVQPDSGLNAAYGEDSTAYPERPPSRTKRQPPPLSTTVRDEELAGKIPPVNFLFKEITPSGWYLSVRNVLARAYERIKQVLEPLLSHLLPTGVFFNKPAIC